jgi:cytochrome c-type biogenesis protein
MYPTDLTLWLAFGAGLLSFVSPCCLPLYPSFVSYITGVSITGSKDSKHISKKHALLHTLFFILGFSIIFLALGLSASLIGQFFSDYRDLLRQLGAIIVAVMGLFMLGLFKPQFLLKEKRIQFGRRPEGYLGSTLIGIAYAAGWTPCIGPILSAVFALGLTEPNQAILYVVAYTMGFGIPFFAMTFFIGKTKWLVKHSGKLMKIGGVMMLLTGVLLYTDKMTQITIFLIRLYGGFTGF